MKHTAHDLIAAFLCLLIYLPFLVIAMGVVLVVHVVAAVRSNDGTQRRRTLGDDCNQDANRRSLE